MSQGAFKVLSLIASLSVEHLKVLFYGMIPAMVERFGDGKQPVRDRGLAAVHHSMEIFPQ